MILTADSYLSPAKPWVCIVRLGGCGDNLIASSVLPILARKYQVEVIAQEPYHVVFENNPFIAKLTIKKKDDFPNANNEWQEWFAKRAKEYEFLINLSHSCETTLVLVKGQTQFYWPDKFRRAWCGRNYLEFVHDIVGVPHEFAPQFYPTEAEKQRAMETRGIIGDPHIGWCLSGSRIDKVYPYAPMVIARLIKELNVPVVMFGAPGKDFEMAKGIHEHVKRQNGSDHNLHLALSSDEKNPHWPLRRILTQIQYCGLVIGPDTGPLWGVAMSSMPKMVMLSHASPENITKHWVNTTTLHASQERVSCWPCHQLHDDPSTCRPNAENNGAACISDISAETIVTTALKLLSKGE